MIALFVDTWSREISVSAVSVTQVAGKGLVLRYGTTVGNLWQLTENANKGIFQNSELPVIVRTGGYSAQSSAGFVGVVADYNGDGSRIRTHVVGIQGMPWQKTHKGLSVCSNPMEVFVLRPGTNIAALETHARRKAGAAWHSNWDCAKAAIAGIGMRAKIRPNSVFVQEGQSDYAQAWELCTDRYEAYKESFTPEFPEEFRAERFTTGAIAQAMVRKMPLARQIFDLALGKIAGELAPQEGWGSMDEKLLELSGQERGMWKIFKEGAGEALQAKLVEGFSFRLNPEQGQSQIDVVSPTGETGTEYLDLGCEGDGTLYAIENKLLTLASNSEDEKKEFRRNRRTEMLRQRFSSPLAEYADEWETNQHRLLRSGVTYRLIPASHTEYPGPTWSYEPARGLELIEASSMSEIFASPRFEELANSAEILFLVSHGENGKAQAAAHMEWGFCRSFGWTWVQSHNAMLKALSK